jgi:hypothetical protein
LKKARNDADGLFWDEIVMSEKIPGDRLVLATISVLRTLIFELSRKGVIDPDEFIQLVQQTAITHRQAGDANNLADAIHALSIHLQESLPER